MIGGAEVRPCAREDQGGSGVEEFLLGKVLALRTVLRQKRGSTGKGQDGDGDRLTQVGEEADDAGL